MVLISDVESLVDEQAGGKGSLFAFRPPALNEPIHLKAQCLEKPVLHRKGLRIQSPGSSQNIVSQGGGLESMFQGCFMVQGRAQGLGFKL